MTGFFNSRTGAGVKNYHYYAPSDTKLHDIGLASYTRNSIKNFGKRYTNGTEGNDPDINEYFSNTLNSIRTNLLGDSSTLIIYRFEKNTKRYLYTTNAGTDESNIFWTPSGTALSPGVVFNSNLKTFQEKLDLYQKGFIKEDSNNRAEQIEVYNIKYILSKINTSLSGCIVFTPPSYTILNGSNSGNISIFFTSKDAGSDKKVALQPPVIAGVARTATGQQHAFALSENLPDGVLSAPDVGGVTNPNNTVAGELNVHFNRGTGKWESGTVQVYCRLLDDLPGVSLPDLKSNVDTASNSDLKVPFESGWGMVMNTEKGNPHLCVPCSFGCGPSPKERLPLINRTPRAYLKGEMVLASQINGDWIPIPLNNGLSVAKKLILEWSQIQKYVANAKVFFKSFGGNLNDGTFLDRDLYSVALRGRFYDSITDSKIIGKDGLPVSDSEKNLYLYRTKIANLANVEENQYQLSSDYKVDLDPYFTKLFSDQAAIDMFNEIKSLVPNDGYIQFYDADIIPTDLGGNNEGSGYLKNTVISKTDLYDPDTKVAAQSVPFSWGMYFPDGYTSSSVNKSKTRGAFFGFNADAGGPSNVYSDGSPNFVKYTNSVQTGMLNLKDNYFYHFPAQMALNSSGNQSIAYFKLHNAIVANGIKCDNLINYMNSTAKGNWLGIGPNSNTAFYGLTPNNTTSVQFTPLSLELALSYTLIGDFGLGEMNPTNGGYGGFGQDGLKGQLQKANITPRNWAERLDNSRHFGKGISRNGLSDFTMETDGSVRGPITFGNNLTKPPYDVIGPPSRGDVPDGGPNILPNVGSEKSNVVGIIAAKATFALPNGGTIELKTDQKLGLFAYLYNRIAGGSVDFSWIGSLGGAGIINNLGQGGSDRVKQWGGSLGDEQYKEFGTTALWCAVYDHSPNTIYDGRYFTPIQLNPSGASMDFMQVSGAAGTIISKDSKVKTVKNTIRRNALLTEGGFSYIKKIIGAHPEGYVIVDGGSGYSLDQRVVFNMGGQNANFLVSKLNSHDGIEEITLDPELGPAAYGETAEDGTENPFRFGGLEAEFPGAEPFEDATIILNSGVIMETIKQDKMEFYGAKKLTKSDNDGIGDGKGLVEGIKTTTFQLSKNTSGKYDLFFFFVSDILNYPEGGVFWEGGPPVAPAKYVNLEITSI